MTDVADITPEAIAPATEQERQAVQTLLLLGTDARAKVMAQIRPENRARIDQLILAAEDDMQLSIDARRRLVRDTSARMYADKVRSADKIASDLGAGGGPRATELPETSLAHPLDALRSVHPAALARAMQGERAEAWALVLDRLEPNAQAALRMYLEEDARVAIEQARTHQLHLAPTVRAAIERAIVQTIVPAALREHARLLSTNTGGPAAMYA